METDLSSFFSVFSSFPFSEIVRLLSATPHLTLVNAFHGKLFLLPLFFHSFHLRIRVDASLRDDDPGLGDFQYERCGSRTYWWLNFRMDRIGRRCRYRKTYNGILIFIHAGTVSRGAAYLLGFLTPFSLRISIFGHMDDPAGGPAGRVFLELAFFSTGFPEWWFYRGASLRLPVRRNWLPAF